MYQILDNRTETQLEESNTMYNPCCLLNEQLKLHMLSFDCT